MTNAELLGSAGETHGLIASNRSEERDNSAPVLNALPHGPPDYHPTEPLRSAIVPKMPPSATVARTDDYSLPHENDKNLFIDKRLKMTKSFNPLGFQTDTAHVDPAQNHTTSGDNRHEVTSGGSLSGVYTAHGGALGFGEGVLTHKGGLGWGDNQSAEMAGGLNSAWSPFSSKVPGIKGGEFNKKLEHDSPLNMAIGETVKGIKHGGKITSVMGAIQYPVNKGIKEGIKAVPNSSKHPVAGNFITKAVDHIPANRIRNDVGTFGFNELARKEGAGIREKHTELVGGGFKAMSHNRGWTNVKGGKSKFWKDFALNLTGAANNVSKIFANASEVNGAGVEIKKKQKKLKGGKSKAANQIMSNLLGTTENLAMLAAEAA